MARLRIGLTLSLAGPRQALLGKDRWPMALRVAVGLADEPGTPDDAAAAIPGTLPWNIWPDELPDIVIVNQRHETITVCKPEAPESESGTFLAALQAQVIERGQELARGEALSFAFAGEHQDVEDADARVRMPWPGLLSTLSTVAQPTPSALKSTWLFYIDRAALAVETDGQWQPIEDLAISATPRAIQGGTYRESAAGEQGQRHLYDGADVETFCQPLLIKSAVAPGLDEMDNYWMSIRDSRDYSLLALAARVDDALLPASLLGAIAIEELAAKCIVLADPGRPASVAETKAALTAWRRRGNEAAVLDRVPAWRDSVIGAALKGAAAFADAVQAEYERVVQDILRLLLDMSAQDPGASAVRIDPSALPMLAAAMRERLLPAFRPDAPRPCRPNEGIELVVGDERLRLVHERQSELAASVDEVAGMQVFGRRTSDVATFDDPGQEPGSWHALTGARYVLPPATEEEVERSSGERVLGVTTNYIDGVLYRELTYGGANLVCRNPLENVHRESVQPTAAGSMLAHLRREACSSTALRALPLRYGDYYEFAVGVIDRAGAMADELCHANRPWSFDPASLGRLSPPQRDRVRFLRRVPLGSCNILPPEGGWPQTPVDVWLRCLEEYEQAVGADSSARPTSVLLVPHDADRYDRREMGGNPAPWPAQVQFTVEPPRLDEHTFQRWSVPATDLPADEREQLKKALIDQLIGIHETRDRLLASGGREPSGGLVFDPAVTAIGLRYTAEGHAERRHILPASPCSISVAAGEAFRFDKETVSFTVEPGTHLRIGLVALVAAGDFGRIDAQALGHLIESGPWPSADDPRFRAFTESVVFVEVATDALPQLDAAQVYLSADAMGNVELRYALSRLDQANTRKLVHVHQMRVSCERWTWRNLPIPAEAMPSLDEVGDEEWRRRLASGPPIEIMDPAARDDPKSELVRHFDALAEVDQGFVRREEVVKRFPRELAVREVRDLRDTVIWHLDQRDGISAADYLRYRLAVGSRYRGVLLKPESKPIGPRRIALPFRGNAALIKPPKILAVLPLTRTMAESPRRPVPGEGTPFLVVLDELWFREYGIGERLRAQVAHVKTEIGEQEEPKELRFGPLPDHSVQPVNDLDPTRDLDCFGPFGFSLDRSGSQAMPNATAFVVYPPKGTPAHYNVFVEFARLLDVPSGTANLKAGFVPLQSARIDALPLYTLPDSQELNPTEKVLAITQKTSTTFSYDPSKLRCQPFAGAAGDVLRQYRYLLLVGRMVLDGGRDVEVFLPQDALWLDGGQLNPLGNGERDILSCKAAVVAEVLLSGRPSPKHLDQHPLHAAKSLRDLFRALFDSVEEDAPGMIRRISDVFTISFQ